MEHTSIIGSWEAESWQGAIYTFETNGRGAYTFWGASKGFSYKDDGTAVELQYDGDFMASIHKYRIEDSKLIIDDSFGMPVTYLRIFPTDC